MIRVPFTVLFISTILGLVTAQTTADFEEIVIPPSTNFLNNAGVSGQFESGNIKLPNYFNFPFQYWEGWAISRETDNQTAGFTNQYSAISGGGAENSTNYSITYCYSESVIRLTGNAIGGMVTGLYLTNSTYSYFSMKNGDAFAKRFGGESGNDPDFLKLTIKAYMTGELKPDSIDFYLADYRFSNNSQDYIVDNWEFVQLSELGNLDSLKFTLSSSDNGIFGMNTPAYFCLDNLITADMIASASGSLNSNAALIYPNPTTGWVELSCEEWLGPSTLYIFDYRGISRGQRDLVLGRNLIDLEQLENGVYLFQVKTASKIWQTRVIKVN
jgi:hypothetical protein